MPPVLRILKWTLICTLGLAAVVGGTILALELSDPAMRCILIDIKYGHSSPLEERINKWVEVLAELENHRSAETMAEYTNSLGWTYQDEFGHDDSDANRMFLARWFFLLTPKYAELTPPSEKRSNQLAFASSLLKQVNEKIEEKHLERQMH